MIFIFLTIINDFHILNLKKIKLKSVLVIIQECIEQTQQQNFIFVDFNFSFRYKINFQSDFKQNVERSENLSNRL
jgi:hypothetical protein